MKPLATFLFLLSFFSVQLLRGQNLPAFRHYNIKGLPPKSVISCIYQDKEGFLWFSGLTGLYRYDGNTLTAFQHNANDSTSLPHNYIVDFCEDASGNLVCGSLGGGLFVINKTTGKVVRPPQSNQIPEVTNGSIISSITPSTFSPAIWCGSSLGALIKYDATTKQFEQIFSISAQAGKSQKTAIPTVLETAPDKLLVASYRGLYFLDASTRKGSPIGSMNAKLKSLDSLAIYSLMLDNANRVWIGYKGGVMIIDKDTFDPFVTLTQQVNQSLSSVAITAITQLKEGQVLLGTNNGIFCWTDWNNMVKKISSADSSFDYSPKSINEFYTDRAGNIWVATEAQGLFLLNKNYSFFKTIPGLKQIMGSNKLQAIMEDQAFNWWIGGEDGLVRYSPKTNKVEVVPLEDNSPAIYSIFEDDKKGIWVGTGGSGVYYIADPQKPNSKQHFKQIMSDGQPDIIDFITSINQDRFGNIWLGSFQSGVFIYKPSENNFLHYRDINNPQGDSKRAAVSQIIRDSQGAMWVSTYSNGINKFIPDPGENIKGKFINYTNNPADSNSLSFAITTGMKQDKSGNLWVSTVSGGLNKFDPEKKLFKRFSIEDGLPSNLVFHIEEDKKGNIWFSTDEGLGMLSPGSAQVINFKEEDGLPTRSFTFLSSCTMRDGTIAFGTIDGDVVYFQPEEMEKNNLLPTIVDFKLFNRSLADGESAVLKRAVYLADTFHLQYDQSVFTFEFSNLDLINPESYTFAYKLDGVDKDWNYISNRKSATYTNLSPGKYVFRLRAANHLGIWSDREITKLIIVSPPWWRTWWAYTLYVLVFAGGLWAFIRYRSLSLLRDKKKLAQQVTIRTAEVVRQKEEIAVQRDNLEQAIHDLKSTQAQLIQSEKMASLGELTAGIAHEIQNPLNFVNNFSEVNKELVDELQQELKAGKIEDAIAISNDIKENEEKINHHGKRADAIVKGMLQHSRSSSGVKEPTDINALADEYLRLAYHGLRAKDKSFNASFRTDFDENIGKINIIPQDIGRVILNLLTNAFYSVSEKNARSSGEQYEPTVTVSTRKINDKVEIRVQDNGNGIPQKVLDKIFQPFFTTKPTGQGTGLGLSMSYDIVTKGHGGELKVETKEGAGTTFITLLPITT